MVDRRDPASPQLQLIRGLPFPSPPRFLRQNIEDAMDYPPRDADVIISSYPKTGTTWLQYIVLQIISEAKQFPSLEDILLHVVPFLEKTGIGVLDALQPPRIYKHHIPYNMVKKNKKSKYLYIYRNPADAFASYFHFVQSMTTQPMDVSLYFEDFLSGNVAFGKYFEHVKSYLEHSGDTNVLLISYETLYANRTEQILRIARFLGEEYHEALTKDQPLLEKIIKHTQFDYMKETLRLCEDKEGNEQNSEKKGMVECFFRKGVIGDGKCLLSSEQLQSLRKEAEKRLGGTSIFHEWYDSN